MHPQIAQTDEHNTDTSQTLLPIYRKAEQLKMRYQYHNLDEDQHRYKRSSVNRAVQPVPRLQLKIGVDRQHQFLESKNRGDGVLKIVNQNFGKTYANKCAKKYVTQDFGKVKSKSQKILHFLQANQSNPNKKQQNPQPPTHNPDDNPRQSFTPMRPISHISRTALQSATQTQLTRRSLSQKHSSENTSQAVRLIQSSKKSSTPNKYLRRGHRMREVLMKQIAAPEDIIEEKELVYLQEYDHWVPAVLASNRKLELEHFMTILVGSKKAEKKQDVVMEPYYL